MNKQILLAIALAAFGANALAKLPPPSDEAKAKAAEAAAKTAHGGKVDGYTAKVNEADMAAAGKMFELVTDTVKVEIMKKASAR